MIEAVAEIAVWFAFWNLGEAAEEDASPSGSASSSRSSSSRS